MPFLDFNIQKEVSFQSPHDFTIIGCGAVGIHIALLLSRKGHSVLILESGQLGEDSERQKLNDAVANRQDVKSSVEWGRKRALGGTTIRWGGQSLPFQELDFQERPWLEASKWPIEYADLIPHYREAEAYLGVGTAGYFDSQLEQMGIESPLTSAYLDYHVSRWAPEPNMFKRHQKELETSIDVLFNAHCKDVQHNNGTCQSVTIQNFHGKSQKIQVNKLIIATGGVESVRFLMLHGLSDSPVLGRGFMEHPCMDLGTVVPNGESKKSSKTIEELQRAFGTRQWKGEKFGIRLSLSSRAQRELNHCNASASLMFETPSDAFDPYESLKGLLHQVNIKSFSLLGHIGSITKAAWLFLHHGFVYKPNATIRLTIMCEQLASDGATLTVDQTNLDAFEQPKLKVNWVIGQPSWQVASAMGKKLKQELEQAFDVEVNLRPELFDEFNSDVFSSVNHHMGGAVMGFNPESSVVSPTLQIHGSANAYLCSAAVFPSASHSNPTLTALALGGRLVKDLI